MGGVCKEVVLACYSKLSGSINFSGEPGLSPKPDLDLPNNETGAATEYDRFTTQGQVCHDKPSIFLFYFFWFI
jgi:hypothetical protein